MKMECSRPLCGAKAEHSPLRLGRTCGRCGQGTWIPEQTPVDKLMKEAPHGK